MKLYTFVVHYLQMCMKEYGCCPKLKRELITIKLRLTGAGNFGQQPYSFMHICR
jgi:hypothetical protein